MWKNKKKEKNKQTTSTSTTERERERERKIVRKTDNYCFTVFAQLDTQRHVYRQNYCLVYKSTAYNTEIVFFI